jgi:isopentenyldiphosphate isomerase
VDACEERRVDAEHDEWVDVIDDDDRVVDRATRADVRQHNLLHRAVYVFVRSSRGELFVHRRTLTKDVYPGYCDVTVGGVVAAGEEYDGAAVRELAEELGVVGGPLTRLGTMRYADERTRVLGVVYAARHDGPFVLQTEEIASGRFVPLAEAERMTREERCCPDGIAILRTYGAELRAES